MKNGKNTILGGAASLGIGAFVAKLLGALYRVPLTNLIGGFGLGLYQTVFPVYALLLDFSGAGVPSALSKLISSHEGEDKEKNAYSLLAGGCRILSAFGAVLSVVMFVFAKPIAAYQGNPDAYLGYVFLSPAILAVSLISCLRGYFQGFMKMAPTALSQVTEQGIKLIFGLLFAYFLLPDIPKAVAGATFAITLSEFVALLQLYITYLRRKKRLSLEYTFDNSEFKSVAKIILKTTLPITLVGITIPLSQVIDSFLVVNILGTYRSDSTVLYGLLSGVAATVVNLPVSVCYGISAVTVPAVSSAKGESEKIKNVSKALSLTLAVSLPCAVFIAYRSPFIVNLLFGGLPNEEKSVAIKLLTILSPSVVLLSLVQTGNAVLIGTGKLYLPVLSSVTGVAIKTVLNFILLKIPNINIYGGAIAVIACYFFTCLINLIMIFKSKVKNESKRACDREPAG